MIKQSPNKRKSEVGAVTTPKKQKLNVENGKTPLKNLANTPQSGKKGGNKTPNAANTNKSPNQTPGKQNNQVKTPGKQNNQVKTPGKQNNQPKSPGKQNNQQKSPGKQNNQVKSPGKQNNQQKTTGNYVKAPGQQNNQVKSPGKPGKKWVKNNKESPKTEETLDDSPKKLQKFDGRNNLEQTFGQRVQKQLKQKDKKAEIIAKNEDDEDDDEGDEDEEDDDEGEDNKGDEDEEDNDDKEDDDDEDDADDSIDEAKDKLATKIKVKNVPRAKTVTEWKYKLFVAGLPFGSTKKTITAYFQNVCKVVDVRIPLNRTNGKPRTIAFVEVPDIDNYNKARSLHHTFLDGRQISVLLYNNNKYDDRSVMRYKNNKLKAMRKIGKQPGSNKPAKQQCVCGAKKREFVQKEKTVE